jgi:hypothetical protein
MDRNTLGWLIVGVLYAISLAMFVWVEAKGLHPERTEEVPARRRVRV